MKAALSPARPAQEYGVSAGATGVRSAASEAKAKAIPIACGALLCGAIAVPSQRLTQKGQSLPVQPRYH